MSFRLCAVLCCCLALGLAVLPAKAEERLRVIISTDAGGDSDDQASFVRLLLYSNDFDIEGMIAENPETDNPPLGNGDGTSAGSGLNLLRLYLNAYGDVRANLIRHDSRYPTKSYLWDRLVSGFSGNHDGLTA